MKRIHNFAAGPSSLPLSVLLEAQADLPDWNGRGLSILEMSHRSADFLKIHRDAIRMLKELYGISDDYEVLFVQGGGHTQFAMVPLNLCGFGQGYYCVNGVWSTKAFKEAQKLIGAQVAATATNAAPTQQSLSIPDDAGYLYYCSNETVNGIRYNYIPQTNAHLVADMSSDFLSQSIDVNRFSLIFAGAQKNFGPAGLTVVIVRKDILGRCPARVPTMLDYQTFAQSESLYNTPPTFAIYIANLVCHWLIEQGGIPEMERRSLIKSQMLYDVIDGSKGFYCNPVETASRSRMNVVFTLGDEALTEEFLASAKVKKIENIKGHRIVGGMRASLYNAVSIESTEVLADFMTEFAANH